MDQKNRRQRGGGGVDYDDDDLHNIIIVMIYTVFYYDIITVDTIYSATVARTKPRPVVGVTTDNHKLCTMRSLSYTILFLQRGLKRIQKCTARDRIFC